MFEKLIGYAFGLMLMAFSGSSACGQSIDRLFRFPSIHKHQVVFTYAGDVYTVGVTGGVARKLTSQKGYEMFARFSPDGSQLAFTGQYDGNTEVYTMPAGGGAPKRLTYTATLDRDDVGERMGPNNIVMTWKPDGSGVVYRSRRYSFNPFIGQLFEVPAAGGMSSELPLPGGGFCSYRSDGRQLAYNKVFREFRTWKYYRGGMADDIWIYDFDTRVTRNITNHEAQDIIPMWIGNEIYFLSDRDRIMNLFAYDIATDTIRKVTDFDDYDVKFPSADAERIIFEKGGFLYVFDVAAQKTRKLDIVIQDDNTAARPALKDAASCMEGVALSPDGNRVLVTARGEIFSVPAKEGVTRNLTHTSGVHEREAKWSPDGRYIAFLSDQTGEFELYVRERGQEGATQLTTGSETYIYDFVWSPDGKKLLFDDRNFKLCYIDILTKETVTVDTSVIWEFNHYRWSPDGNWIAYARTELNKLRQIYLYSLKNKQSYLVTEGWYDSYAPCFSDDGAALFFVSKRSFQPLYSEAEWNSVYVDMAGIYMVLLQKGMRSPFVPENSEVAVRQEEKAEVARNKQKMVKAEDEPLRIDIDGMAERIVALPVEAATYWNLTAVNGRLYYNQRSKKDSYSYLKMFDLQSKKETELAEKMSYEIAAGNGKMLLSKDKKYFVVDLPITPPSLNAPVDFTGLQVWVDPLPEWRQVFNEAWRQMRDFMYDPHMHGVDWQAMKSKYEVLLPYVRHREDLNYIIGEMIGELNVGHAYVDGGDYDKPKKIYTGLLGAKISKHVSGHFVIEKILEGTAWDADLRSPLKEPGLDVREGDFIVSINGRPSTLFSDVYEPLAGMAGRQVEIGVNSIASLAGARTLTVVPVRDESNLYHYNWVQRNMKLVDSLTNGAVGYVHVPDMGPGGLNEFMRNFYPQLSKKALIIDDRGNQGGNVSPMIIERLSREVSRSKMARNIQVPDQVPDKLMAGPKVMIVDKYSASDGDLFAWAFRQHGLGKVIGERTWGGVVGIRGSLPFVDGTQLRKPEFGSYHPTESKWIIEGHGVDPDIVVVNDPAKEYAGTDEQLLKAIEVILEELENTKPLPEIPAFPDKSK